MRKIRTATVTSIVPQDGRKRGYLTVMTEENSILYFYGQEWKLLKKGDKISVEYTSTPSQGGWSIRN